MEKEYKGSCYLAVVGGESEIGVCRDSIEKITVRPKDQRAEPIRATKGYEARQMHLNNWYYKTKHPFMLLLDHDMWFPPNTLEVLRATKKPFISGFYMRRMIRPVMPVWYERGEKGVMPMRPLTAVLETNKVYPIGASGWGCMLIHRDVITAVKPLLKGEPEIIEDDMDIYPYDLKRIMDTLALMESVLDKRLVLDIELMKTYVAALREEIRPLRGVKDAVGSDIRFPFYAQLAGFELYGHTGVVCQHMTQYPVSLDDWLSMPAYAMRDVARGINEEQKAEKERLGKALL